MSFFVRSRHLSRYVRATPLHHHISDHSTPPQCVMTTKKQRLEDPTSFQESLAGKKSTHIIWNRFLALEMTKSLVAVVVGEVRVAFLLLVENDESFLGLLPSIEEDLLLVIVDSASRLAWDGIFASYVGVLECRSVEPASLFGWSLYYLLFLVLREAVHCSRN